MFVYDEDMLSEITVKKFQYFTNRLVSTKKKETVFLVVITKCFCFKLTVFGMSFISKEEKTFAIKEGRVPPYTNKDSQMHS